MGNNSQDHDEPFQLSVDTITDSDESDKDEVFINSASLEQDSDFLGDSCEEQDLQANQIEQN